MNHEQRDLVNVTDYISLDSDYNSPLKARWRIG